MDGLIQQLNRDKLTVCPNRVWGRREFWLESYFMQCCSSFSASAENLSPPLWRKLMEPTQTCRAPQEFCTLRPAELSWNSGYSDLQIPSRIQQTQTFRAPQEFSKVNPAEPPWNFTNSDLQNLPKISTLRLQSCPKILHTQTGRTPQEFCKPRPAELPQNQHIQTCRAHWEFRVLRPSDSPKNSANSELPPKFSTFRHSELPRNSVNLILQSPPRIFTNSVLQSSPGIQHIRPWEFPQNSAHSDLQSSPGIQNLFIKPSGDTLGLGCALVKSLILHRSLQAEELTSGI